MWNWRDLPALEGKEKSTSVSLNNGTYVRALVGDLQAIMNSPTSK